MRLFTKKTGLVLCLIGATAAALTLTSTSASASSSAPRNGDVLGVGSDTLQNAVNFLFDGSPGSPGGYNSSGNNHRAYSFDATGDANGRATYDGTCGTPPASDGLNAFCDTTTNLTPNLLPSTSILRIGTNPVTTPNGSGAGIAALTADANSNYQGLPPKSIQFARLSRLPNATEEGETGCATDTACGGLHVYQIAYDNLTVAVDGVSTDAPSTGLSITQLANIYDCTYQTWQDVADPTGATHTLHTGTKIHALIPQSGSGTRNFFIADMQAAKASTYPGTTCGIRTVEEHDPTGIYGDPSPADAIEPFSVGKLALIASGYFQNAGYVGTGAFAGKNAYSTGQVVALGGSTYNVQRGLYIAVRNADTTSTTPFQAGGSGVASDFFNQLFGPSGYVNKSAGKAEIAAAGFLTTNNNDGVTPAYKDCLVNPTSC